MLTKLWKVKFGVSKLGQEWTDDERVMRTMGEVFTKGDSPEEVKKLKFKLPIESITCVGLIVEKGK